jgi:hypothetical protein
VTFLTTTMLSAATAAAQQPLLTNARVETHAVTGGLDKEMRTLMARATEPAWIGYAVPALEGDRSMCCWSGDAAGAGRTGCRLEPGTANAVTMTTAPDRAVPLEAGDSFFVLFRVEQGQVNRIRIFSEDCPLDGGGRAFHWLTGVRPTESIDFLTTFTGASATNKIADSALSALAMHRDPAALDRLVAAARDGATTHLRGHALFWLAQRAGEKAVGAISDAIARDPETEVKRRAVFALSQLPKDQGVPLLIQVARTNANPSVRKQAIFWLGQSKDPRALKFFEEILFK